MFVYIFYVMWQCVHMDNTLMQPSTNIVYTTFCLVTWLTPPSCISSASHCSLLRDDALIIYFCVFLWSFITHAHTHTHTHTHTVPLILLGWRLCYFPHSWGSNNILCWTCCATIVCVQYALFASVQWIQIEWWISASTCEGMGVA